MISYYADVMEDGAVRGCFSYVAPPTEGWAPQIEGEMMPLDEPIDWSSAPSNTCTLYRVVGKLEWVDKMPLEDVTAQVLDEIDTAADLARVSVLVKTTKAEEYMQAETQAREWQAAGYLGDAPPDVASWAAAKWREQMTDQQAADSIVAQADQYRTLLSGIRALRLKHMEDARHAADAAGARAVLATFTTNLSKLMKGTA